MRPVILTIPTPQVQPVFVGHTSTRKFYGVELKPQRGIILRDDLFSGLFRVHHPTVGFTEGNGWSSCDNDTLQGCITRCLTLHWDVYEFDSLSELAQWAEGQ